MKTAFFVLIYAVLFFALFSCATMAEETTTDDLPAMFFINVGKADAAILFSGDERYLIDTGTSDSFDQLQLALETYQITTLDGVFITHTDKDHVGGLKKLCKSDVEILALYAPVFHTEKSDEDHPAYGLALKYDIAFEWLSAGDVLPMEGGQMVVLSPLVHDTEKENNNSLVLDVQTDHGNFLLTGDMELPAEELLLFRNLVPRATILKVAHHGEDDATSPLFVSVVSPQVAIISTSTAERDNTPSESVLRTLSYFGVDTFVTQDVSLGYLVTLENGNAHVSSVE